MVAREAVETSTGNHRPCFLSCRVEVIQHDSRLDHAASIFDVERDDAVQVLREIDDDTVIDSLTALRRAAAAWRDDPAVLPDDAERPQRFVDGSRDHDPRWYDLIKRSVGRIPAAVEGIEEDVARNLAAQARGKGAVFSQISEFFGSRRRHRVNLV
jgi:hypothetical protein